MHHRLWDVAQSAASAWSQDLAQQYQQQIFHHVLFWVVGQFFKCSLLARGTIKTSLTQQPRHTCRFSFRPSNYKPVSCKLPRLPAKTIIKIGSLSHTYNGDYSNWNVKPKDPYRRGLWPRCVIKSIALNAHCRSSKNFTKQMLFRWDVWPTF